MRATVADSRSVQIRDGDLMLDADLRLPVDAVGLVVFAHGSGSSRHSRRNRDVAEALGVGRLGTLLLDLLTAEEESIDQVTYEFRFDIDRLGRRVVAAIDWALTREELDGLHIGCFGASTGAAAALIAAAMRPAHVGAVVSRGGRPDLAGAALSQVRAPTLLIVGGADAPVLELNERAMRQLSAPTRLEVVAGATHLFEEAGAMQEVSRLAFEWFALHLGERT